MFEIVLYLSGAYILLFLLSLYLKDNSIVDIFWGLGFVMIAWIPLLGKSPFFLQIITTLLITAWGVRLALNIWLKKILHTGEDKRYAVWRQKWKYFYLRSFFQVYLLQMILMLGVATPLFFVHLNSNSSFSVSLTLFWSLTALFGLLYETIADTELRIFMQKKNPWEILTFWLRRFHRYPQYFGESVFWFGICIISSQISILAFFGWILITLLLCFVSGIPLLEKRYEGDQAYAQYSKKTPLFFPDWKRIFFRK